MLNKVSVYSSLPSVPALVLNLKDMSETDLYEVRNIDGLGPVKADISTTQLGSSRGASFGGVAVGLRNLVFTLGLRPDWDTWTVSKLRRNLDSYFTPGANVTLIFESDENAPVAISGYVESNESSIFSKDPEQQVSIICPQPDFVSVDPIILTGGTGSSITIDYEGTLDTGMYLELTKASGDDPTAIIVTLDSGSDPRIFRTEAGLDATKTWAVQSVDTQKFVRNVTIATGVVTNLLAYINESMDEWPKLKPGSQTFDVEGNVAGLQNWTLTYYERFGSL